MFNIWFYLWIKMFFPSTCIFIHDRWSFSSPNVHKLKIDCNKPKRNTYLYTGQVFWKKCANLCISVWLPLSLNNHGPFITRFYDAISGYANEAHSCHPSDSTSLPRSSRSPLAVHFTPYIWFTLSPSNSPVLSQIGATALPGLAYLLSLLALAP
jgi:hypothetical protein